MSPLPTVAGRGGGRPGPSWGRCSIMATPSFFGRGTGSTREHRSQSLPSCGIRANFPICLTYFASGYSCMYRQYDSHGGSNVSTCRAVAKVNTAKACPALIATRPMIDSSGIIPKASHSPGQLRDIVSDALHRLPNVLLSCHPPPSCAQLFWLCYAGTARSP